MAFTNPATEALTEISTAPIVRFSLLAFSSIFFLVDPFACIPSFLAITHSADPARRKRMARKGARTAWHSHPLGQTRIVTAGCGRAQHWGGPIEEICPGDVVWISHGEKHWHGAAPTTAMTHIAMQEKLDGKAVEWLEKVTDEQYNS